MDHLDINIPSVAEDASQRTSRHDSSWSCELLQTPKEPIPLNEMVSILSGARDVGNEALSLVVRTVIEILNDGDRRERVELLSEILNAGMLASLLNQRRTIRSQVNTAVSPDEEGHIVVTWVDALIAALSRSISALIDQLDPTAQNAAPVIRSLRHDDWVRPVCLLPHTWDQIPHVLSSGRATKSCRRTALTLLFGVYIMAPKFAHPRAPEVLSYAIAQKLRDNIQTYAHERVESEWEYHDAEQTDLQPLIYATTCERKDDAMALSLYAVSDRVLDSQSQPSAIFRPRTLSNLIVLIMTIMQDTPTTGTSGTQSPILNIDGPQATLLLWGGFTSWAWQTWTPDTPHYSVIIKMTATWFYSIAPKSRSSSMSRAHQMPSEILASHVPRDPVSAFVMMHAIVSMILDNLGSVLPAEKLQLCNAFGLLCHGLARVLRCECAQTSLSPRLIQDTRRLVCNIVLALVELEECLVEDSIVTFLVEVHRYSSRSPLDSKEETDLTLENSIRIVPHLIKTLWEDIQYCTQESPIVKLSNRLFRLKLLIDILVLLLADNDDMTPRANIAMLTPDIFKLLCAVRAIDTDCASHVTGLVASSVLLLCEIVDTGITPKKPLVTQGVCKSAQEIILQEGSKDLVMTMVGIQLFTRAKIDGWPNGIDDVAQYNFLRDALLLNFTDSVFFYVLAPSLCWSLRQKLVTMRSPSRQHVLRSPWTTSVLALLEDLHKRTEDDGFSMPVVVREQLLDAACGLAREVRAMRQHNASPPSALRETATQNRARRRVSLTYAHLSPEDRHQNLLAIYSSTAT